MPSPYGGIGLFVKNMVAELKRNNFDVQNYSKYQHQLEVYVDEKGTILLRVPTKFCRTWTAQN